MLDIRLIREQTAMVKEAMRKLGAEDAPIDRVLELDEERRAILAEVESLRARRNAGSKEIGQLMREGRHAEAEALKAEMSAIGQRIPELEERLRQVEAELQDAMLRIPNLPHPKVPVGRDERDNVIIRTEGELRQFDFEPLPHWELGPALDIIDFERGVKISGSRFYVLKGLGARLQRALITWMIDLHVNEHGYTEVYPPFVVKAECLVGTGNLPKFGDNLYHDVEEDFWLIPTAEVPVTNLHRDEILPPGSLPIYYVAYTPCWRREKMSAGRDVRGIKRGHQFDKVEMVKFVEPSTSDEELEKLVDNAEDVCRKLGLPHRVVQMCTGDLSFTAAMKYDIEVWAPGCQEWLEVSSCSNFMDFQARRANIRYRPAPNARPEFVHTLNGSGLALPRVMIAILENYQQKDGSVVVPEVLRPYMGGVKVIR
ncbi:MAG: serine--tRNA ligase [Anaerolineae bacterium]|nr:serine--tRNA ligase [Anaerolineae bacterium]MDW8100389.1 serine--tRNA ligase [Anaerolineae bacterium]